MEIQEFKKKLFEEEKENLYEYKMYCKPFELTNDDKEELTIKTLDLIESAGIALGFDNKSIEIAMTLVFIVGLRLGLRNYRSVAAACLYKARKARNLKIGVPSIRHATLARTHIYEEYRYKINRLVNEIEEINAL